ncbi:hypothetical protein Ciccas_009437 [Cichlidogyrus casuarinus]|uniref:Ferric reductase NAD binding domain-containing protein n=1 Tax=Cichlidogyrus casuarinus TaxID=1844966 RepID=A0ABD2PXR2_9PLAT
MESLAFELYRVCSQEEELVDESARKRKGYLCEEMLRWAGTTGTDALWMICGPPSFCQLALRLCREQLHVAQESILEFQG